MWQKCLHLSNRSRGLEARGVKMCLEFFEIRVGEKVCENVYNVV